MITEISAGLEVPRLRLQPPVGLAGIVQEFGDVREFVRSDGSLDQRWEAESLGLVSLPFPLLLSWDHSKAVSSFRCHHRLTGIFSEIFGYIAASGLASKVRSFGGCFVYRPQRTGAKLSTHSWGIAIDLNPESNGLGMTGDMAPEIVQVFRDAGFTWGGQWSGAGRDAMHFQYCSSY